MKTSKKFISFKASIIVLLSKTCCKDSQTNNTLKNTRFENINARTGFAAALVTIALAIPTFIALVGRWSENYSEDYFIGAWVTVYTDEISETMSCRQVGTTELYRANRYAYHGTVECPEGQRR